MFRYENTMERRWGDMPFHSQRALEEREDCRGRGMPGFDRGRFRTLPERPEAHDFGPRGHGGHSMPGGHGMPGGPGFPGGHGMPGGPGFPGRPGFPGGHGMPGGGRPPEPSPDFLRQRIEEADLSELLELAGRMALRRPEGGPAQGQSLILSILAGRESLSQRALQQMLGVQPGSLSEILTKLERKGCLTREKAEDRRGNLLRITDAGRQAIPQADAEEDDDPFAPLTDDQQDQLAALLRSLLTAWVEDMEPAAPRGRRLPPFHCDKPVEI